LNSLEALENKIKPAFTGGLVYLGCGVLAKRGLFADFVYGIIKREIKKVHKWKSWLFMVS
jgi:hypothetical protein